MSSKPTSGIFPIENGKLITSLDCNNLQLLNLDESNLSGGGGGSGNDTGTTTAILKGDGNHGFADAVGDVDYATPGALDLKESITDHDADIMVVQADITTIQGDITTLQTDLADKADDAATTAALALKADDADLQAYITSNDAAVALKASTSSVTTALALKADTTALTAGLALKEDLLPTTANDGWILARHDDDTWFFVDPVSLGTTNQSFNDGVSNTDTSWNSDQANFTNDDVGLSITGDNIQAGTTISSVTDENTIVLSQATTGTGTGKNFTILNRLTITTGSGTVTSVGVNNTATSLLTIPPVSNPTTSPTISFSVPNAAANTFYGNNSAIPAAPSFLSASASRTALGGTAVGQNFFLLASPGVVSYPRINVDNTITARTAAQTLGDLGGESALTFSSPLTRATNTVSIPAATDLVPGHLTAADHAAFTAKVPNTRSITTTSPLTVNSGLTATLAADITLSMPQSTAPPVGGPLINGWLSGTDFQTFLNRVPPTRTIGVTAPLTIGGVSGGTLDLSANRTIAMPAASTTADGYLSSTAYNLFAAGAGASGTTFTVANTGAQVIPAQTPPITRVIFNTAITQSVLLSLPAAAGYGASLNYPFIEFVDIVSGGAFQSANAQVQLIPTSSNTIEGASSYNIPKGMGYLRLISNGLATSQGRWTPTKYFVDSISDPLDTSRRTRIVLPTVSAAFPTATTRTLTLATGNSVTVVPDGFTDTSNGFIYDYGSDGVAKRAAVPTGVPDTTGHEGEILTVVSGDAVWSGGSGASPYQTLTPVILDANTANIPWPVVAGQRAQNAIVTLPRTTNYVLVSGALEPGMHFSLYTYQDGTGSRTLKPPFGSATENNGLGLLTLTATPSALDHVEGNYIGDPALAWGWGVTELNLTKEAVAVCNDTTNAPTGAITGVSVFNLNSSNFNYVSNQFYPATSMTLCRVDLILQKTSNPSFTMQTQIYTDAVSLNLTDCTTNGIDNTVSSVLGGWTQTLHQGQRITGTNIPVPAFVGNVVDTNHITLVTTKGGATAANTTGATSSGTTDTYGMVGSPIGSPSNVIASSTLPVSPDVTPTPFPGMSAAITANTNYHLVLHLNSPADTTNFVTWLYSATATPGFLVKRSVNGTTWTQVDRRKQRWVSFHA